MGVAEQSQGDPTQARELWRNSVRTAVFDPSLLTEVGARLPPEVPPLAEDFAPMTESFVHRVGEIPNAAGIFRDAEERFAFLKQILTSESIGKIWSGPLPGPNENDLGVLRVALAGLELGEAHREEVLRLFDAAVAGDGEPPAEE